MPEAGFPLKRHEDILSLEELFQVAAYAVSIGFSKIRLTGGEPLGRKNIEYLVSLIGKLDGLKDFGMTTNGWLLPTYAASLKEAGLHRINLSLDSLDPEKYRYITRGGELAHALAGLDAAQVAGLTPVKINVVLIPGWNDGEKDTFLTFGETHGVDVRFIPQMDLHTGQRQGVEGNTTVGQCALCNRLRLTCDGWLKPCLFSEYQVNIRDAGIAQAFDQALHNKPEYGSRNEKENMYQIGG